MDRNQLLTLDTIAREGSFGRAARTLVLSQAAISARIQALEEEVGGALFTRGGRRAALTPLGESFLPHARRALAILAEGLAMADELQSGHAGRVTLHAPHSTIDGFLAPGFANFLAAYPCVSLVVTVGHTDQIVAALRDDLTTLGLVTWRFAVAARDLAPLVHFREPLVAAVAPTHRLAHEAVATIADFIAGAGPFYPIPWGTAADHLIAPPPRPGGPTVALPHELVCRLVVAGHGGAFFPRALIADSLATGTLVVVPIGDSPPPTREIALVRRVGDEALPLAALNLIAALRDAAGEFVVR